MQCPCSPEKAYEDCCKPFHHGKQAPTAEKLMRSRYSAYVLKLSDYITKTWHPSKRPKKLDLSEDQAFWLRLEIVQTEKGREKDQTGIVEFLAFFEENGSELKLQERSNFVKKHGNWLYRDGKSQIC